MSRRSSIERLPAKVREEVDSRLIAGGFSDYTGLAAELRNRGYHYISKSGLHRYGQELERKVQLGRARMQLEQAGIDAELAAELTGEATLVVVIDRRNGRARLISMPAAAARVISHLKAMPS